jgi:molybdopterin-biosynthesis enzyme MoeA-like protein
VRAELLAVGSELLDPARRETNALYITGRLREIGIDVAARVTLADDADLLRSAFAQAWGAPTWWWPRAGSVPPRTT